MGLTLNEGGGGSVCNAEAVRSVAFGLPDASLTLLAPLSSSPAVDEAALIDSARFEADIVCQLYFDPCKSLVKADCAFPLVMNHLGRTLPQLIQFQFRHHHHLYLGWVICLSNLLL